MFEKFKMKRNIKRMGTERDAKMKNVSNYIFSDTVSPDQIRKYGVSLRTMAPKDFFDAIGGRIIEAWEDKELMRMIGVTSLVDPDVHVVNELNYEEACDCIRRTHLMELEMLKVMNAITDRAEGRNVDINEICQKNQKIDPRMPRPFLEDIPGFSADALLDLVREMKTRDLNVSDVKIPDDINEAITILNKSLLRLPMTRDLAWSFIGLTCGQNFINMTGYSDENLSLQ